MTSRARQRSRPAQPKQRKAPFDARRAARALSRTYDQALAGVGLKNTQFSVLYALSRTGPAPIGTLAEALVMERTTLTRNLRPLEREGWVELGQKCLCRSIRFNRVPSRLKHRAQRFANSIIVIEDKNDRQHI